MPETRSGEINFYEFTSKALQIAKGESVFGIWNPPGETEIEFGDSFRIETNAPRSDFRDVSINDSLFLDFGNPQWGPEEGDRYKTKIVIPWAQEIIAIGGTVPKAHVRLSSSPIVFLEEGFIELDKVHGLCHLEALGAMSQINVNKLNGVSEISAKETSYFGNKENSGLIVIEGQEI